MSYALRDSKKRVSEMIEELHGQCLCGAIRFVATGDVKRVSACYCGQCRKQNGGGAFYGAEMEGELVIKGDASRSWYASSEKAKRAFCAVCGSSLFWRANNNPAFFDISLGVISDDFERALDAHIFVDNCPSYMVVPDTAAHLTEADVLENPLDESG